MSGLFTKGQTSVRSAGPKSCSGLIGVSNISSVEVRNNLTIDHKGREETLRHRGALGGGNGLKGPGHIDEVFLGPLARTVRPRAGLRPDRLCSKNGQTGTHGEHLPDQFQSLAAQLVREVAHAADILARVGEAGDQASPYRIGNPYDDYRGWRGLRS